MQGELSATPLLTIDKVEKVQRQRIASFIGHVFLKFIHLYTVLVTNYV